MTVDLENLMLNEILQSKKEIDEKEKQNPSYEREKINDPSSRKDEGIEEIKLPKPNLRPNRIEEG